MSENISEPESSDRLSARVAELEAKLAEAAKHQLESDARIQNQRSELTRMNDEVSAATKSVANRGKWLHDCEQWKDQKSAFWEIERLTKRAVAAEAALREAQGQIHRLLIGGNHLAVALSGLPLGWEKWHQGQALDLFAGQWQYDVWVAWRIAMDVSEQKRALAPQAPEKCPHCNGRGKVQSGTVFETDSAAEVALSTSPCRPCNGTGNAPAPAKCPLCGGRGGEFFRDHNEESDWRDCPACMGGKHG